MADPHHVYEGLLGGDWNALPEITRALHSPEPRCRFAGKADIRRGSNPVARLLADFLGLPPAGDAVPAIVEVSRTADGDELLERWYDGRHFATLQQARDGVLSERFGPFTLAFRLAGGAHGIDFHQDRVLLWGLPLPALLAPRVTATERAHGAEHCFNVRLDLPGVGLVIAYSGRLRADRA